MSELYGQEKDANPIFNRSARIGLLSTLQWFEIQLASSNEIINQG